MTLNINYAILKRRSDSMINNVEGTRYILDFVKNIIDKHGPRLPGSKEEKEAQKDIFEIMKNDFKCEPVSEEFQLAPRSSIGAIPYLGAAGFAALALYYIHPLFALVISACTLIFAVVQVFLYKGWFDFICKKETSRNTYSVIDGKGTIDHTIVFSGHTDSSWLWNMAVKNPKTMILRTVYGIVGVIIILGLSIIRTVLKNYSFINTEKNAYYYMFLIIPLLFIPGIYSLCIYLSYDKKKASPGAMDNLTGVGAALYVGKYFTDNSNLLPDNCRIIIAALGSEEAGLKGSFAFMKKHADDKNLLINPYFVNIDSLRDYDHFNVVIGDTWQGTRFDKDMESMLKKSISNAGIEPHVIYNPVGGCDSTPICKKGYKTITFAVQNPVVTDYYHTYKDTYDGLNENTIDKSIDILLDLTEQIHAFNKNNPEYRVNGK